MNSGTGDGITSTVQACAACKFQRRKCSKDCLLAPYFPYHHRDQFLKTHKLFGVRNISKMIKNLNQTQKDIAMRTIVFQADARAKDPAGGCYRIIRELRNQIERVSSELDVVLQQLSAFRAMDPERLELYPRLGLFPFQKQFIVEKQEPPFGLDEETLQDS